VRVAEFSIRKKSGGIGRYSGGNGIVRKLKFLEEMTVTVLSSHRIIPPHGTAGGSPGNTGENKVLRANGQLEKLNGNDSTQMQPGDTFIMRTPGGGGFGEPI
jgi:5-oxoprolinase (ATP-hydrolysing)